MGQKEFILPEGTHQYAAGDEVTCWYDINTQMNYMSTMSTLYHLSPKDTFEAMLNTAYGIGYDIHWMDGNVMSTAFRYAMEAYGIREPKLKKPQ